MSLEAAITKHADAILALVEVLKENGSGSFSPKTAATIKAQETAPKTETKPAAAPTNSIRDEPVPELKSDAPTEADLRAEAMTLAQQLGQKLNNRAELAKHIAEYGNAPKLTEIAADKLPAFIKATREALA
jgi:hypothetical protein